MKFHVSVDPKAGDQLREIESTSSLPVTRGRRALVSLVAQLKQVPLSHEHAYERSGGAIYGSVTLPSVPIRVEWSIDDEPSVTIDNIDHAHSDQPRRVPADPGRLELLTERIHARSMPDDDLLDELIDARSKILARLSMSRAGQLQHSIDILQAELERRR